MKKSAKILLIVLAAIVLAFAARITPVTQTNAVRLEMLCLGYPASAMFSKLERFYPYGDGGGGFLASYRPLTLVPYDDGSDTHLDQWSVLKNGWFYSASFGYA